MDVNFLRQMGLEALLEEDDMLFGVADILDSVTLPPIPNAWAVPPPAGMAPAFPAQRKRGFPRWLALALNILIYIVCAAVIAASLILRFSKYNDSILGYHIYHVESGSMTPMADGSSPPGGFRENDAIIVKNAAAETVKKGDVITFWQNDEHEGETITHRVLGVEVLDDRSVLFTTKGDANDREDVDPVPGSRLVGVKVLRLPKLGGVLKAAREHPWVSVGISLGVMAVVLGMFIVSTKRASKKNGE
ncbi:MAG: signal peptidase I [Firmicutes bacterium]|nr:signal peptidase I [Bacillota bacterium]